MDSPKAAAEKKKSPSPKSSNSEIVPTSLIKEKEDKKSETNSDTDSIFDETEAKKENFKKPEKIVKVIEPKSDASQDEKTLIEKDGKFLFVDSEDYISRNEIRHKLEPHPPAARPKTSHRRVAPLVNKDGLNKRPMSAVVTPSASEVPQKSLPKPRDAKSANSDRDSAFKAWLQKKNEQKAVAGDSGASSSSQKDDEKRKMNQAAFEAWCRHKEEMRIKVDKEKKTNEQPGAVSFWLFFGVFV